MGKIISSGDAPKGREQSTISFPYVDLDSAISVAEAMRKAGAVPMSRDQVAVAAGMSANSGAFLNKLSATRMFGLVTVGGGQVILTPLAFLALDDGDDDRGKAARAEAFLNVPLFRKIYDEFRGRQLPPRPHGLEQALISFGVANNQKGTARGTFDRSAQQAGFFPDGRQDRLVAPIRRSSTSRQEEPVGEVRAAAGTIAGTSTMIGGASISAPAQLHPFIQGLIAALPPVGSEWPAAERANWLQAAANNFNLMYKGGGTVTVVPPVNDENRKILEIK